MIWRERKELCRRILATVSNQVIILQRGNKIEDPQIGCDIEGTLIYPGKEIFSGRSIGKKIIIMKPGNQNRRNSGVLCNYD
jgi:hypothetical protein